MTITSGDLGGCAGIRFTPEEKRLAAAAAKQRDWPLDDYIKTTILAGAAEELILKKVEPSWARHKVLHRSQAAPLPGFSGQSAMNLIEEGRGLDVLDYLEAVDAGVHA